jgi:hypothetical protein
MQLVFETRVITIATVGHQAWPRRVSAMTTLANVFALMGIELIRFGGRGGGGFVFLLFGLAVIGLVVWALTRSGSSESAKN